MSEAKELAEKVRVVVAKAAVCTEHTCRDCWTRLRGISADLAELVRLAEEAKSERLRAAHLEADALAFRDQCEAAEAERDRLRSALTFYAEYGQDAGARARNALSAASREAQ